MRRRIVVLLIALYAAPISLQADSSTANLGAALQEQRYRLDKSPNEPELWNDLANLLILADRLEEAEAAYHQALGLDPENATFHFNLGLFQEERGQTDRAWESFNQVLAIDPNHGWAHYCIGAILEERNIRAEAITHYSRAFLLDPDLLFPKLNPHIIENGLILEALLQPQTTGSPGTGLPPIFSDAERIVALLVAPIEDEDPGRKQKGNSAAAGRQD